MLQALFLVLSLISLPSGYSCDGLIHEFDHLPALNNPCQVPTDLTGLNLHITNYQPYELGQDENGNLVYNFYAESNYQCQAPCNMTANGTVITDPLTQNIAACPLSWVNNRVVVVINGKEWHCEDTFGLVGRQNGLIWHEGLNEWVICIDLLTHIPHYYQTNEWYIRQK